jgi:hypothetical protein
MLDPRRVHPAPVPGVPAHGVLLAGGQERDLKRLISSGRQEDGLNA